MSVFDTFPTYMLPLPGVCTTLMIHNNIYNKRNIEYNTNTQSIYPLPKVNPGSKIHQVQ